MTDIHLNNARKLLDRPEPFSIDFLTADGACRHVDKAVSLRYDFETGTRRIKCLASGQIRRIRDVLIMAVNDIEVFI